MAKITGLCSNYKPCPIAIQITTENVQSVTTEMTICPLLVQLDANSFLTNNGRRKGHMKEPFPLYYSLFVLHKVLVLNSFYLLCSVLSLEVVTAVCFVDAVLLVFHFV